MNRRRFFKALGVLSAAAVVAPVALAEMRFAEDPHPWNGRWGAHTMSFDPSKEYGDVVYGSTATQQDVKECLRVNMEECVPPEYRHRVRYKIDKSALGESLGCWYYRP